MEKISVVIPTYNREKTILRAIQSVLEQTYTNLEVLVIDDGSTDGTEKIVKGINDDRVQYIVLGQNGGPANARNQGVKLATGEWVAFQDSDDCWYPDKLEKQMQYAKEHPEYSMIYCICNTIFKDGHTLIVPVEPWPEIMEGDILKTLLVRNVMDTPTMFVKKEAFMEVGGFSTDYKALEDWEYAIRFSKKNKIGFVPEILMDGYMLNDGVSSNIDNYFECRCKMLGKFKTEMIQEGVINTVMEEILMKAQERGRLELVKNRMMLSLVDSIHGRLKDEV